MIINIFFRTLFFNIFVFFKFILSLIIFNFFYKRSISHFFTTVMLAFIKSFFQFLPSLFHFSFVWVILFFPWGSITTTWSLILNLRLLFSLFLFNFLTLLGLVKLFHLLWSLKFLSFNLPSFKNSLKVLIKVSWHCHEHISFFNKIRVYFSYKFILNHFQ